MTIPPSSFSPHYLPIGLQLDGVFVLVIGGGNIAANKTRLLLACKANIGVIANALSSEMQHWKEQNAIHHLAEHYSPEELARYLPDCRLVYVATDDKPLNHRIAEQVKKANIPVCVVDDPEISTFITPAIIDRDPVKISITTAGSAPVLARRLRQKIEAEVPAGIGKLASFMGTQREYIRKHSPDTNTRRRIWEKFIDGPGGEAAQNGQLETAHTYLTALINDTSLKGEVWLVGGGTGNPDLLTLKALHCMQNADCIFYDQLLSPELMDRVRRDADRIFVGKRRNHHTMSQHEINQEMIRRAQKGERVLRLKGGDPLIFGRGGEEAEALMQAGISFQIVPGITAATGCAAYGGIPLTHRDDAQSCLFITGHARADGTLDLPWKSLVHPSQTVVIYMGLSTLKELCRSLIEHGLPPDWPAALVEKGTLPSQRVFTGTLSDLPEIAHQAHVTSPALTIIGKVVRHRTVSQPHSSDVSEDKNH